MRFLILASLVAVVASRCYYADDFNDKLKPGDTAISFKPFNHNDAEMQCAKIGGKLIITDTKAKIGAILDCDNGRYSPNPYTWIDGQLNDIQLQWSNGQNISNALLCPGEDEEILELKSLKNFKQADFGVRIHASLPCLRVGEKSEDHQYACEFKKTP